MTTKVRDIMTPDVVSCRRDTNLADAAKLMWDHDCGVLPVVDAAGHVAGMLTDRDICMAVATRDRAASRISAAEASAGHVFGIAPDADLAAALDLMRARRVRRLPVIDEHGTLRGLLSMNDIVLFAGDDATPPTGVVGALRGICAHRDAVATV